MKTLIIIWLGQMISIIGSSMTGFAFTIWVWELTGQATTLALFGFFTQIPQVFIAPTAGVIVDRWNRKYYVIGLVGILTIAPHDFCDRSKVNPQVQGRVFATRRISWYISSRLLDSWYTCR
ncbi:hypothetical protein [Iningainema tapete]|uniref:hypothetical protein n=1 Tax=Iningainema tapete TaxID=2806730 RepID=UPI001EE2FF85|nr:hypothetical protein [Iningainema tapete]